MQKEIPNQLLTTKEQFGVIKKFRTNPFLWVIPLILSGIGILMITSTTGQSSFHYTGAPFQMGIKQIEWLIIAITCMLVVYLIPLQVWYKLSAPALITTWILCWLPLISGVGETIGGARRWIHIPGVTFAIQPGELLCLAMALHLAKLFSRDNTNPAKAFVSTMILVVLAGLPLLIQPDLGTTMLIFIVAMGMYVEKFGWKRPVIAGGVLGGTAFAVLVFFEPYRMRRIASYWNPWNDPLDAGFQAIQGLIAFSNGGFWGSGLGHGFQKLNYLPAAYTDYIFAAIGEELGLIGTLSVLALYMFWVSQARKIYLSGANGFKPSLTWGITLSIVIPFLINVAGVTKLLPLTGMPLPFISYGGSSLLTMWSRVGIMMRVEKENYFEED